jgi:uncharacterized protein YjiK
VKNGKGANKDLRNIFAFDLSTKSLDPSPIFELNQSDVIQFANENKIQLPRKHNKKSNSEEIDFGFGVSAIGVHPTTNELYVLCAYDHVFLIYSSTGELKEMLLLNKEHYPQAEGITFLENGDLLISNEGQDGEPTLVLIETCQ